MEALSILVPLIAFIVPVVIGAFVLYWIIRLGVKHGLGSYYRDVGPGHRTR